MPLPDVNAAMTLLPLTTADSVQAHAIHEAVQYTAWSQSTFDDCLTPPYEGWMIKLEGKVVGFCILLFVLDEATLMEIAVAPEAQGQGLGKAMLNATLEHCKTKGMHTCWLEVRASNQRAIQLYTSHGFQVIEIRKGYYPTASGREDAIVMMCELAGQPA
ncbi:ribosomal protein S18-alanine N-acetyltransferase [Alteromonas sp. AMM-1]